MSILQTVLFVCLFQRCGHIFMQICCFSFYCYCQNVLRIVEHFAVCWFLVVAMLLVHYLNIKEFQPSENIMQKNYMITSFCCLMWFSFVIVK